jgi:peroxiredoxin/tetratricopeptide (TPR) repeat protein
VTFTIASAETATDARQDAPPPEIPGYELVAELGRGGMGVVYHARQTRLNREVALKMILAGEFAAADVRLRFLAEAEVVAKLQHPNIVQLYEFNVFNGVPYFSLEYVGGGALDKKLAKQPLPPGEAAALIETLARAIHYAHERGVVHRDLKPGNILLQNCPASSVSEAGSSSGAHPSHRSLHGGSSFGTLSCVVRGTPFVPKVTDFGLAKCGAEGTGLTVTGAVMGTPSYMAPEQAGGRSRDVGPAADTYSLGAILYECLTGRPPFQSATPFDTVMQVVHEEPVPPKRLQSKVDRDLETICLKCLQKEAGKRYATTLELADDLARYLNGEAIRARPVGPIERTIRWARRRPAAAALIAVLVVAATVIGVGGWVTSAQLGAALKDAREQREQAVANAAEAERLRRAAEGNADEAARQQKVAEQNAAEANKQRQAVAGNLTKRFETVDDILFNMDGRLANMSGGGPAMLRREFLDEIRKFSDRLLKDSPDDPQVIRQSARVYRSIGDLSRRGDPREADTAYDKALRLTRRLAAISPDKPEYKNDLAQTSYSRALALGSSRRFQPALEVWGETVQLFDDLATSKTGDAASGDRSAAVRAARAVYFRADVLEEMKRVPDAVAGFRDALTRQEKLVAADPKDDDVLEDLGFTAFSLAGAVETADQDLAAELLRKALAWHKEAARLAPQRSHTANVRNAYDDLYTFCQRHRRAADLAAVADEYQANPVDRRYADYNAGCYYALAAKVAADSARADEYAAKAVSLLDAAAENAFTFEDRVHLLKDADLDGLRDRADYKALVAKLDRRFPGRPVTPAELLASLRQEFDGYLARYDQLRSSAVTLAERRRAQRSRPDFPAVGDKVLKLAAESKDSAAAMDALTWVLETGAGLQRPTPAEEKLIDRGLAMLDGYLFKPEFANACRVLGANPSPGGDKLLAKAAGSHADRDVRGLAAFALGLSFAAQAEGAKPGSALQGRLSRQAEDQFEKVVKGFGPVFYLNSTLGAEAKRKLYEVRSLSIGRLAREIEGETLDGKRMTLSGQKGKVTLVFFWANWCGFCRQLYPSTRDWAEKYKARQFAVVGVNCDDDPAAARRAVDREKLTWPSWWDGGPSGGRISEQWQVNGFPNLYLIDAAGVIRKKWQEKPDTEDVQDAIEVLLKEAERGRK